VAGAARPEAEDSVGQAPGKLERRARALLRVHRRMTLADAPK
jgi:hypothetical protein